jgi:hypothetical protein
MEEFIEEQDFYWEGGFLVFTRQFHLRRGRCCGSGCRHCPYEPRWTKGTTTVAIETTTASPSADFSEALSGFQS